LPMSLDCQSSLEPEDLLVMPGTTRGILADRDVVVVVKGSFLVVWMGFEIERRWSGRRRGIVVRLRVTRTLCRWQVRTCVLEEVRFVGIRS
jgi:hypothetical protein